MKLVIQRVKNAQVKVGGRSVGKIGKGLFVLVGVGQEDSEEDALLLSNKLIKMRVMGDNQDKMNLSVKDVKGSILAVSQFTLFADTKKGNRPSFIKAALPEKAKKIYNLFVESLKNLGVKTETGRFGEYMHIDVELDGPITIVLDSKG